MSLFNSNWLSNNSISNTEHCKSTDDQECTGYYIAKGKFDELTPDGVPTTFTYPIPFDLMGNLKTNTNYVELRKSEYDMSCVLNSPNGISNQWFDNINTVDDIKPNIDYYQKSAYDGSNGETKLYSGHQSFFEFCQISTSCYETKQIINFVKH